MEKSPRLNTALFLESKGLSVIPLRVGHKRPFTSWLQNQKDCFTKEKLTAYWTGPLMKDWNVGAVCGQVSKGLTVVDIDPRNGGLESFKKYDWPDAPRVNTAGGGFHLYYRSGESVATAPGWLPGIDIKGEASYVIAASSYIDHEDFKYKGKYTWAVEKHWDDFGELPELPGFVKEAIHPAAQGKRNLNGWAEDILETLHTGGRNNGIAKIAGRLFYFGLPESEVLGLILAVNRVYCKPPLNDSEVLGIVESIGKTHDRAMIDESEVKRAYDSLVSDISRMLDPYMEQIERRHALRLKQIYSAMDTIQIKRQRREPLLVTIAQVKELAEKLRGDNK